jgi:HEAT repeat protein
LEAINAVTQPREAERQGVRAVPWTRIGPFELSGALSPEEVRRWIQRATEGTGWSDYCAHLIENRQLDRLLAQVRQRPATLVDLVNLFADKASPMTTRIGISAVLEELAGSALLADLLPELEQLTHAASAQIRADACHFIGLSGNPAGIVAAERLLDDEDPEVREIAAETLELLRAGPVQGT